MGERVRVRANWPYIGLMTASTFRRSLRYWAIDLAVATVAGLFLGLIGPYGSYLNGPLWQTVAFQICCFWLGTLIFGSVIRLLLRFALPTTWLVIVIIVVVALVTLPFSMLVARLGTWIWPFLARNGMAEWYVQGLITAEPVVLGLTFVIKNRMRREGLADEAMATVATRGGLLAASPADILCLQMEDHYVRVHVAAGSHLVLATLSQAIAALGEADGLQVHRSWWVARKAVVEAEVHGRNLRLRLTNGVSAPVSRASVAILRAANWIK